MTRRSCSRAVPADRTCRGVTGGRSRAAMVVAVVLVALVAVGCGLPSKRGAALGHLRDMARRVEGGGAECPLAIPPHSLRPPTVARDAPILPLRVGGPASVGVVGEGLPTDSSVRITCRYLTGGVAVTVDLVGVSKGHALAVFGSRLNKRGDGATVLTFIDVNADLPVGRARSLPGQPPAAFARVSAASGDVAIVLSVDRSDPKASLPSAGQVEQRAVAIAASLAE